MTDYKEELEARVKLAQIQDDLGADAERQRVLGGQSLKIILDNTRATVQKISVDVETQARATRLMAESMNRMSIAMQELLGEYKAVRKQNDELLSLLNYKTTVGSTSDSGTNAGASSSRGTTSKTQFFMCGEPIHNKYDTVACFLTRLLTLVREAEGPTGTGTLPSSTVFSADYDVLRRTLPEFARTRVERGAARLRSGPVTIPEMASKSVVGVMRVIADNGPSSHTPVQAVDLHEVCQNPSHTEFVKACLTIAARFVLARGVVCPNTTAVFSAIGDYPMFDTSPDVKLRVNVQVMTDVRPITPLDTRVRELKPKMRDEFIRDCCVDGAGSALSRLRNGHYDAKPTAKSKTKG